MKEIIQRQRQMMDEYHLDALVTMSPENITYVTGTAIPTQLTVRQRQVIHILTPTQGPEVIVVNIEEPIMRAQGWIDQDRIVSYNEFTQTPIRLGGRDPPENGGGPRPVGVRAVLPSRHGYGNTPAGAAGGGDRQRRPAL